MIADINEGLPRRSAAVRKDGTIMEERHDKSDDRAPDARRLLPRPFAVLRLLTFELREPTFKEVVITCHGETEDNTEPGPGGAGIVLKSFHDIPIADMEMIFTRSAPGPVPGHADQRLLRWWRWAFLWTLISGVEWTKEIITLISVLGGKVKQSVTALMAAQTRGMMAKEIQQKGDNSDRVLMHLMESMGGQGARG